MILRFLGLSRQPTILLMQKVEKPEKFSWYSWALTSTLDVFPEIQFFSQSQTNDINRIANELREDDVFTIAVDFHDLNGTALELCKNISSLEVVIESSQARNISVVDEIQTGLIYGMRRLS